MKEYETQVKVWKKELGQANRKHINLQKKLRKLESTDADQHIIPTRLEPCQEEVTSSQAEPLICCSICSLEISCYIPEYFMGEVVNPACERCRRSAGLFIEDESADPFSSFPDLGVPSSIVSHWIPPHSIVPPTLLTLPSLRAHYVLLPNPGSCFISMDEVLEEFKAIMDKQRRELQESCRQT